MIIYRCDVCSKDSHNKMRMFVMEISELDSKVITNKILLCKECKNHIIACRMPPEEVDE